MEESWIENKRAGLFLGLAALDLAGIESELSNEARSPR